MRETKTVLTNRSFDGIMIVTEGTDNGCHLKKQGGGAR